MAAQKKKGGGVTSQGTSYPCPACDHKWTRIVDTRTSKSSKRRRRECQCGERFTTYEIEDAALGDVLEKAKLFDQFADKISKSVSFDVCHNETF